MKVLCPACGAKYSVADDKVRGRRVKIRCKSCGQSITVDGTQEREASSDAEATHVTGGPPGSDEEPWTVDLGDAGQRQYSREQLIEAWQAGTVSDDTYAWREGMADWLPITQIPELAEFLGVNAQRTAVVVPQPALRSGGVAARAASPRGSGHDLFGDPTPPPPSTPGSQAYEDFKPTGARNESSVLFSLDALKAGAQLGGGPGGRPDAPGGPRPPARGARPEPAGGFDDLFGMPSAPSPVMLSANVADLLAAPPPPEPAAPPPVASTTPSGPSAVEAPKRKVGVLVAAALGAVVVIGGGAALALSGGESTAQAPANPALAELTAKPEGATSSEGASRGPTAAPAETSAPVATATAATGAPEAPTAPSEPASPAEPANTQPPSTQPTDTRPPNTQPTDTRPANTQPSDKKLADAIKPPEKKDDKKKDDKKDAPPPAPAGGSAPFDKGAAVAALNSAAGAAAGCKKPGGPTGTGRVTVTFAPSGRATNANVSGGAFGGSAVGGCIAAAFRRARVPPFSGDPVTVGKSFTIPD